MADIDLAHINAALTRIGNDPITSFSNGTLAAQVAAANYESVVKAEISANPWKIASKVRLLNLLDSDVVGTAPEPWLYSSQLPGDSIGLRTVKVAGSDIDYATMGQKRFCDCGSECEVVAHYLWRVQEAWWPAWFAEGLTRPPGSHLPAHHRRALQ